MTLSVNFQMREFHWAICGTVITLDNSLNNTLDKKDNLVKRQRKAASLFLNGRGGDGVLYVRCSDSFYSCLDEKVSIRRKSIYTKNNSYDNITERRQEKLFDI